MTDARQLDRQIMQMRGEIDRLKAELQRRPIKSYAPSFNIYQIQITGGNTLSDGSTLGIQATSAISTVPKIYNPNSDTTYVNGIGYGVLLINGVAQSGHVLTLNDTTGPIGLALPGGITVLTSANTVSIPLAGDSTQSNTLYVAYAV